MSLAKKCYQVRGLRVLNHWVWRKIFERRVYAFSQAASTLIHNLHWSQELSPLLHPILRCKKSPLSPLTVWKPESPSLATKVITAPCTLLECSYQSPIHRKKVVTRLLSTKKAATGGGVSEPGWAVQYLLSIAWCSFCCQLILGRPRFSTTLHRCINSFQQKQNWDFLDEWSSIPSSAVYVYETPECIKSMEFSYTH